MIFLDLGIHQKAISVRMEFSSSVTVTALLDFGIQKKAPFEGMELSPPALEMSVGPKGKKYVDTSNRAELRALKQDLAS